jgi:ribokinase
VELDVLVVGSVNVDVIARVPVLPAPGTTVTGGTLERHGGGKGANQAVAAARLGARVGLIAAVGDDPDGAEAVAELRREGIDVSGIAMLENTATGVALIVVDDGGENQIAVASGANQELDAATVTGALDGIELTSGGVCLVGFEVSDAAIEVAAQWASAGGHRVLIVPAPARRLTEALIACTPILTPNAGEAAALSDERSPGAAAAALSRRTTSPVAVTLGKSGVVVADGDRVESIPAYETTAVDTTGAGDTFSGALAVGLSESRPFGEAVQRAQAAAALSTRTVGARTGMPTSVELEAFLADRASS